MPTLLCAVKSSGSSRPARARFGALHGVIHAAGVPDGALLGRQTGEAMARVFAPKTVGTRLLLELLAHERLDFCLFCSALSATTGAPGQAVYTAANSFLEHVALVSPVPWPIFAVGWDAWRDVGMAWRHQRLETSERALEHPFLRTRRNRSDGRVSFQVPLRAADWILSEHPAGEQALLPGTAYLELAAAAARDLFGDVPLEIQNAFFLQPLLLDPGEEVELEVTLAPEGEQHRFEVNRVTDGATELYSAGWLSRLDQKPPAPIAQLQHDYCELGAQLSARLQMLGPRWQCLNGLGGRGRNVASLALDDAYSAECGASACTPALLDVATGFAVLDQRYDPALLPFGYGRLRLHAPLPPRISASFMRYARPTTAFRSIFELPIRRGGCSQRSTSIACGGRAVCRRPRTLR